MASLTIQPSGKDNYLNEGSATTNYGTVTSFRTGPRPSYRKRAILSFDFSALPAGAVISAATLDLYYYAYAADPVNRTIWVYELTQPAWVETESTWNIYSTGNNWAAAGGDYTTADGASLTVPGSYGWMSWNVLNLVKHFQSTHAEAANFLLRDGAEDADNTYDPLFYGNNYVTDTAKCPKLIITYTVPAAGVPQILIF